MSVLPFNGGITRNLHLKKEFDGGSHCFQMITITVNGKSTQAQITDQVFFANDCFAERVTNIEFYSALDVLAGDLT